MARDFGRLVNGANRAVEEFQGELVPGKLREVRRAVEHVKDEARHLAVEQLENTTDGRGASEVSEEAPTTSGAP